MDSVIVATELASILPLMTRIIAKDEFCVLGKRRLAQLMDIDDDSAMNPDGNPKVIESPK